MEWEYRIVRAEQPNPIKEINIDGKQGWELITVIGDNPYFFYFKRPKPVETK